MTLHVHHAVQTPTMMVRRTNVNHLQSVALEQSTATVPEQKPTACRAALARRRTKIRHHTKYVLTAQLHFSFGRTLKVLLPAHLHNLLSWILSLSFPPLASLRQARPLRTPEVISPAVRPDSASLSLALSLALSPLCPSFFPSDPC